MTIHDIARANGQHAVEETYNAHLREEIAKAVASVAAERDEARTLVEERTRERDAAREEAERNERMLLLAVDQRDQVIAKYDNHMATHAPTPDPGPDPEPEPGKVWLLGMSTEADLWGQRAGEVGHPVNVRRRFRSSWGVDGLVALARDCHAVGCLPYISSKLSPSTWQQVASGSLDRDAERLGSELAALGYRVRVNFHHEPRPASTDELVVWGQALTRIFARMRAGAGTEGAKRLILGPTDNGFPWGLRTQGVTKADLDRYYSDAFLGACDVLGADFYDGATDTTTGQPAWEKMRGFAAYFDARGFEGVNDPGWKYDAGEYNYVDPADCDALWAFLTSPAGADFNCLAVFNSAANNRDDLPSILGGSWVLRGERLTAFRRMLDVADVRPVSA